MSGVSVKRYYFYNGGPTSKFWKRRLSVFAYVLISSYMFKGFFLHSQTIIILHGFYSVPRPCNNNVFKGNETKTLDQVDISLASKIRMQFYIRILICCMYMYLICIMYNAHIYATRLLKEFYLLIFLIMKVNS